MANEKHLDILRQGIASWNQWRKDNPGVLDLSGTSLFGIDYHGLKPLWKGYVTDLSGINLSGVNLDRAFIESVNLSDANLSDATLSRTNLRRANLSGANLRNADLYEADLYYANLRGADLSSARLTRARLVDTDLENASLENCNIYGIFVWEVKLNEKTNQQNLVITDPGRSWEAPVAVDNLEVAQFVYLLLKNEKIRNVIDTIGKRAVLILGRFTTERKEVLDAIRVKLRQLGYVPIVFDFERPRNRDFTETVMTLAGMCLFVIADITNPRSSPLELQATVPNYMIPFVPIIQEGEEPFSMFRGLKGKFDWVLDTLIYDSVPNLINGLERAVIRPALEKHSELITKKAEEMRTRNIKDYL